MLEELSQDSSGQIDGSGKWVVPKSMQVRRLRGKMGEEPFGSM